MNLNVTTIHSLLDNHRRNANGEDEPEVVDDTERLWVIIGFVLVLLALQTIGVVICCKDRWLTKKRATQTQENRQSQVIEITETLTSARQPKKGNVVLDDDRNNDPEAGGALLDQSRQHQVGDGESEISGGSSVVQVHRAREEAGPSAGQTRSN